MSRNLGIGIGVAIGIDTGMFVDGDLDSESDSDPDADADEHKHLRQILFMRLGAPPAHGGLSGNFPIRIQGLNLGLDDSLARTGSVELPYRLSSQFPPAK